MFYFIVLYIIAYILFFQYKVVYEIGESWKNDSYSECSDMYRISCRIGGATLFIINTYLLLNYLFN